MGALVKPVSILRAGPAPTTSNYNLRLGSQFRRASAIASPRREVCSRGLPRAWRCRACQGSVRAAEQWEKPRVLDCKIRRLAEGGRRSLCTAPSFLRAPGDDLRGPELQQQIR